MQLYDDMLTMARVVDLKRNSVVIAILTNNWLAQTFINQMLMFKNTTFGLI